MAEDLLVSSVRIPWHKRVEAQKVINHIHDLLDDPHDIEPPKPPCPTARAMFRPDEVVNIRYPRWGTMTIPAAAEQLIHWDGRGPGEIFIEGLWPLKSGGSDDDDADDNYKLYKYVSENTPSVFVSTTQPYLKKASYYWNPRPEKVEVGDLPNNHMSTFEYEIFAYGGIDVNRVLGDHDFANQHEIAFPGGIRAVFIRAARQYHTKKTVQMNPEGSREVTTRKIIKIWRNDGFSVTDNPTGHVPTQLPPLWTTDRTPDAEEDTILLGP